MTSGSFYLLPVRKFGGEDVSGSAGCLDRCHERLGVLEVSEGEKRSGYVLCVLTKGEYGEEGYSN